jgi:sugar transferase (PEP-CTERM system associated)
MIKIFQMGTSVPAVIVFLVDLAILILSFYFGLTISWVEFQPTLPEILSHFPKAALFAGTILTSMFAFGLYRRDEMLHGSIFIPRMIAAAAFAVVLLTALFYTLPVLVIWRSILAPAGLSAVVVMIVVRRLARTPLGSERLKRQIAVIGCGNLAAKIEKMQADPMATFACHGYAVVNGEPIEVDMDRLLPPSNAIDALIKNRRIEQLVIATTRPNALPLRAMIDCRLSGIRIIDYQTFSCQETGRVDIDNLTADWFFVDEGFHAHALHRWAKRSVDLLLAAVFMIVLLPLFALIMAAIKMQDGGPVFYRQARIGRRGAAFSLLKFRSMRTDAEADGQPRWSDAGDERVTLVGKVLRRFRLDELPQLWNIFKGEMSFVGPRPERPHFVKELSDVIEFYPDRHAVKPGLTGWAQVNFPYANTNDTAFKKLEFDLYYVKFGSVLMDIVIILQTIRVIFWPNFARQ